VDELENFKTEINLTEYAAGLGYVLDRKASSRNSVVMREEGGDKIVIARGHDRHWIYFSVRDDSDNGTILDFVQNRKGVKLLGFHRYLEEERHIPRAVFQSPRFADRLKVDFRSNAIFPHADRNGPCGYQIKNKGFTGFARGWEKGLWFSAVKGTDTALVIAESGREDLRIVRDLPEGEGRDWNDRRRESQPQEPAPGR